jgi:hypothetical protein
MARACAIALSEMSSSSGEARTGGGGSAPSVRAGGCRESTGLDIGGCDEEQEVALRRGGRLWRAVAGNILCNSAREPSPVRGNAEVRNDCWGVNTISVVFSTALDAQDLRS